jgi:1,2-diacylglycerol 3-beta-galactosyltransferase
VAERVTLLFLVADTGGGHRGAARAVQQALERGYPGRFACVTCDPLLGPSASLRLRWLVSLYGPAIRLTPWLYGMLWRSCNSPARLALARRTMLRPAYRSVRSVVSAHQPSLIAVFHPFTAAPAVLARQQAGLTAPVVVVITDLVTAHLSWRDAGADLIVVPSEPLQRRCQLDGLPESGWAEIGLPVAAEFLVPAPGPAGRRALRRARGLREEKFVVLMTGGAEGSGGIYRRAAALLRHAPGIDVAVICGRNRTLRRRLGRLAGRADTAGRLLVRGYVEDMADWLRCADVVVGKAGPGTIAEAACCGVPLIVTCSLPGQENGNVDYVVRAGAGSHAPTPRDLVTEVRRLQDDPAAVEAMRQASAALSRPHAADDIASLLAGLAAAGSG